jgi:hypothetical protein
MHKLLGHWYLTLYGIGASELKKKNGRQLKEEVFDMDSITDGSNLVIAHRISATKIRRSSLLHSSFKT